MISTISSNRYFQDSRVINRTYCTGKQSPLAITMGEMIKLGLTCMRSFLPLQVSETGKNLAKTPL